MNKKDHLLDDYFFNKCEEILMNDLRCIELNRKIIDLESDFKKHLSSELLDKYNRIENAIVELDIYKDPLLYKGGLSDELKAK